jgi:hypothetical protein
LALVGTALNPQGSGVAQRKQFLIPLHVEKNQDMVVVHIQTKDHELQMSRFNSDLQSSELRIAGGVLNRLRIDP